MLQTGIGQMAVYMHYWTGIANIDHEHVDVSVE